ncbi:ATP-binding protein [Krasilnikovia sp. MM14-A1004]|uniref:ATP-binding protein n=1 Tax=Krasilnikovia sp. MM14-A1004 TaxID=3373541 RepID=UPI00399CBC07
MRREESPFLLSRASGGEDQVVVATGDFDTAITEIAPHGRWTRELRAASVDVLRKCLADAPAAIVVDLRDLGDPDGASAPLWMTARTWGDQQLPTVPVVVCLPTAAPLAGVLRRRGARWFLPVYATAPEARAALLSRHALTERITAHLEPDAAALPVVPEIVRQACTSWDLPGVREPAERVLTELVDNAIEHAGTRIDVALTRRSHGLHLAVHDRHPGLPWLPGRAPGDPGDPGRHGLGLRLVHATATAWGAVPTRKGKMVWAAIAAPHHP